MYACGQREVPRRQPYTHKAQEEGHDVVGLDAVRSNNAHTDDTAGDAGAREEEQNANDRRGLQAQLERSPGPSCGPEGMLRVFEGGSEVGYGEGSDHEDVCMSIVRSERGSQPPS